MQEALDWTQPGLSSGQMAHGAFVPHPIGPEDFGAELEPGVLLQRRYASPATCKPSVYSQIFKSACPKSYSYAYDNATSTFTCTGADYTITFYPSATRQKSARDSPSPPPSGIGSETGTGELPFIVNSPWFPNFFTEISSKSHPCPLSLIATLTMPIFFSLQYS
ncbi:Pathogenesis-related protein 5 [Glycine soja]|nr:Pathogenesis-related protein 5 [Glycine soja]